MSMNWNQFDFINIAETLSAMERKGLNAADINLTLRQQIIRHCTVYEIESKYRSIDWVFFFNDSTYFTWTSTNWNQFAGYQYRHGAAIAELKGLHAADINLQLHQTYTAHRTLNFISKLLNDGTRHTEPWTSSAEYSGNRYGVLVAKMANWWIDRGFFTRSYLFFKQKLLCSKNIFRFLNWNKIEQ